MVERIVAWVTEGLVAPGVSRRFGRITPPTMTCSPVRLTVVLCVLAARRSAGAALAVADGAGWGSAGRFATAAPPLAWEATDAVVEASLQPAPAMPITTRRGRTLTRPRR